MRAALRAVVPDLEERERQGRIEIADTHSFSNPDALLRPQSLAAGYSGLRTTAAAHGWTKSGAAATTPESITNRILRIALPLALACGAHAFHTVTIQVRRSNGVSMELMLERLSESVASAESLEQLTRPLLEMLEIVTGLESVYLTSIDEAAGIQFVDFARNSGDLQITEGLAVPWSDTLCKRCIDDGCRFTSNVSALWGDSEAAKTLGIETYASAPISASNGLIIGTLCAASKQSQSISPRARSALNLFSKIIAQHIERERLLDELQRKNEYLTEFALTDSLTGLPNRRAFHDELNRLLARAARDGSHVIVGMIDLDGFKKINDDYGHAAGDKHLKQCAELISSVTRETDMLARLGGDEFAYVSPGPVDPDEASRTADQVRVRIADAASGTGLSRQSRTELFGLSVGVIAVRFVSADQALAFADTAMYENKRKRKLARSEAASR